MLRHRKKKGRGRSVSGLSRRGAHVASSRRGASRSGPPRVRGPCEVESGMISRGAVELIDSEGSRKGQRGTYESHVSTWRESGHDVRLYDAQVSSLSSICRRHRGAVPLLFCLSRSSSEGPLESQLVGAKSNLVCLVGSDTPPLGSQVRVCRLFLSRSATPVDASALSSETCFLRAPVCPASVREVVETSEARETDPRHVWREGLTDGQTERARWRSTKRT